MDPLLILVSGIPRAGKSSFADAVEASSLGLTHVPMDKYIKPIPPGMTFLPWVKEPSCVDWELLMSHLEILFSGRVCFTPKPDWGQSGRWISEGGPIKHGPGRRMTPCERGYVVAGTHVFSLPEVKNRRVAVYVDTPDAVIASRVQGGPVCPERVAEVIFEHLGDNPVPLRPLRSCADLAIDGTWPHEKQIEVLRAFVERLEWEEAQKGGEPTCGPSSKSKGRMHREEA